MMTLRGKILEVTSLHSLWSISDRGKIKTPDSDTSKASNLVIGYDYGALLRV